MPIRQDLQRLGFEGENLELAVAQAGAFYKDKAIAGYIADRVIAAYTDPGFQAETDGLVWPLIERGMGHLSTRELQFYYGVEQAMINALPSRDCGMAVRGRMSDKQFSETMSRMTARLTPKTLKEFYRIELKAAQLGADRSPVRLSASDLSRIATRVEERMTALIAASPDADRLASAQRDIGRADNARACKIGRLFYEAVLTLNRNDLRKGLIYLGQL
jgi:hypothetical protein